MTKRWLIYNTRIHTMTDGLVVDSAAVNDGQLVAVGNRLDQDPDFKKYRRVSLEGCTVVPGLTDAHTHLAYYASTLRNVHLNDLPTLGACLEAIGAHARKRSAGDWILGDGYSPDRFRIREEPTAVTLDAVTGGRPAFLFSKDEHSAWVNSRALKLAGIGQQTKDPEGGRIERDADGRPTGILREMPAINKVFDLLPRPSPKEMRALHKEALAEALQRGVTGVHSFDDAHGLEHWPMLAESGKLVLRVDYYAPIAELSHLAEKKVYFGQRRGRYRIAGVKLFADGSLGSQSALCFNKYKGSRKNFGIQVLSGIQIARKIRQAAKLNLPAAVHAIGDKAVANVLDAFESAPKPAFGARHRIEHLQLMRRRDVRRLKKLGIVASMQPSHCPSDAEMTTAYWGARSRNTFMFKTLLDKGVPLAFGSDMPIEPLNPLAGIDAAVRRKPEGKRTVFHPEQRISAYEALHGFTAGAAYAVGSETYRGRLLPGYVADMTVLSADPTRVAPGRLRDLRVLATVIAGKVEYSEPGFDLR